MSRGSLALTRGFGGGVRVQGIGRGVGVVAEPLGPHLRKGPAVAFENCVLPGLGLPALNGDIDVEALLSHRITLDEVNHGFELMEQQDGIRSVITFGGS